MKDSQAMLQVVARILKDKDVKQKGSTRQSNLIPEVDNSEISEEKYAEILGDLVKMDILSKSASRFYKLIFHWDAFNKSF